MLTWSLTLFLLPSLTPTPPTAVPECKDRVCVVCFLEVDCPLARLYAPRLNELHSRYGDRVVFIGLVPGAQDRADSLRAFIREYRLAFPLRADPKGRALEQLKGTRSPEVFLFNAQGIVCYRGRIDDQYAPGSQRAQATKHYLRDALDAVLAGKPVAVPQTEPVGCLFDRGRAPASGNAVTYSKDIAPIFYRRCVSCHRPGAVGPFPLTTYDETRDWVSMIEEVIRTGRMPPWGADRKHGRFANDPSLTGAEQQLLRDWIVAGSPSGNPADLPPLPAFPTDGWDIKPDTIYTMPEPFGVPAEGTVEYKTFMIDPQRETDGWIQAIQIRPGNSRVVHHATLRAKPKGTPATMLPRVGPLADCRLAVFVPGQEPVRLPPGFAKRLPGGWELALEIHYVTVGSHQKDQTQIGVVWADPKTIRHEVATWICTKHDLLIPPHATNHRETNEVVLPAPVTLFALFPHMHLRGREFACEAIYPDGSQETLLSVPRYDFAWQHRYVLAEPKPLPKGTVLRWIGRYDNSAGNPVNPDPTATVRFGQQTTEEMFQADFEVYLPDPPGRWEQLAQTYRWPVTGAAVLALALVLIRSRQRNGGFSPSPLTNE